MLLASIASNAFLITVYVCLTTIGLGIAGFGFLGMWRPDLTAEDEERLLTRFLGLGYLIAGMFLCGGSAAFCLYLAGY